MSTPRYRRLKADQDKLIELTSRSRHVRILSTEGTPPEKYVLELKFKSITHVQPSGEPIYSTSHQLGIWLHPEYPRHKPVFQFLTPIYNPNIAGNGDVCIGDEGDHGYAPNMGLDDLVQQIIHIIRYENIGLDHPYNLLAAQWADRNKSLFPLDKSPIITEETIRIDILDEKPFTIDILNSDSDDFDIEIL